MGLTCDNTKSRGRSRHTRDHYLLETDVKSSFR
jgi:hypothetical protein